VFLTSNNNNNNNNNRSFNMVKTHAQPYKHKASKGNVQGGNTPDVP